MKFVNETVGIPSIELGQIFNNIKSNLILIILNLIKSNLRLISEDSILC